MFELHHGDCLDVMPKLGTVDAIICDPPYGTTACSWESGIPFDAMWTNIRRMLKKNGPAVFTASQPFTSALVMSNVEWFKYEWAWVKNRPTNFAHAKNKPMKKHENVLVFSEGTTVHATQSPDRMPYFPQGVVSTIAKKVTKRSSEKTDAFFADRPGHGEFSRETTGYPHTILEFRTDQLGLHPTAKPVALMEYLIKTYTNEWDTVLDFTMGSGTTGVACGNTGRKFIGIEKDPKYFEVAKQRIEAAYLDNMELLV